MTGPRRTRHVDQISLRAVCLSVKQCCLRTSSCGRSPFSVAKADWVRTGLGVLLVLERAIVAEIQRFPSTSSGCPAASATPSFQANPFAALQLCCPRQLSPRFAAALCLLADPPGPSLLPPGKLLPSQ